MEGGNLAFSSIAPFSIRKLLPSFPSPGRILRLCLQAASALWSQKVKTFLMLAGRRRRHHAPHGRGGARRGG